MNEDVNRVKVNWLAVLTQVVLTLAVLPIAAIPTWCLAQTVTYEVPDTGNGGSQYRPMIGLNGTMTTITSGCLPPNTDLNGTVTEPAGGGYPTDTPWQLQALYSSGQDYPYFVLPAALQPSAVVVFHNGVSESDGQSFDPAPISGLAPGSGAPFTESYSAAVAGSHFIEKYILSGTELDSDYDIVHAVQVFGESIDTTTVGPTGTPYPGCVVTRKQSLAGSGTIPQELEPALVVPAMLPPATAGVPYKATFITGADTGPGSQGVGYQLLDNPTGVPPGLVLNHDGTISGTPTAPSSGSQTFTITLPMIVSYDQQDGPVQTQIVVNSSVNPGCNTPIPAAPAPGANWYQLDPAWASLPYDAASQSHSESGPHTSIGDRGDMLTALAYMLSSAGIKYTPATLDYLLGNNSGDFSWALRASEDGGSITLGAAVMNAARDRVALSRAASGSQSGAELDALLCQASVPVMLQVNDPATSYRHYVVATSKNANGYTIVDPGFKSRDNLSAYGNKFLIVGALQPPTADDAELDISIVDNATLRVTAPDGSNTGVDSPDGAPAVKGGANAAYFVFDNAVTTDQETLQPSSTTYSVQYRAPTAGASYTVAATGLHTGIYYVTVRYVTAAGTGNTYASTPGIAFSGSSAQFRVLFSPPAGAPNAVPALHLARVPNFTTALSDVTAAYKVGLIGAKQQQALTQYLSAAQQASYAKDATHERQELQALNAVELLSKTLSSTVAASVINGDAAALIATIP